MAQTSVPIRVRLRRIDKAGGRVLLKPTTLAVALALLSPPAQTQTVTVVPHVEASLRYTDNSNASSDGGGDWVGEVSPAISVLRDGGRLRGNFNARLRNVMHFNDAEKSNTFVALQGFGAFEAVEKRVFVDVDASINRNNRSLFFGRSPGDPLDTARSNETRTFGISPRWLFRIGPETSGSVAYASHWMSGNGGLNSQHQTKWDADVSNPVQFGRIGWGLTYHRSETESSGSAVGTASQESGRATLFVTATPQFRLRGFTGFEKSEFGRGQSEDNTIVGGGFDWYPTDRTSISATTENRFFGRGYDVSVSHRRPLSLWNLSYARDVSSSVQTFGVSVFSDPVFKALYDALAQIIPDPVFREAVVRRLLGYPPIGPKDFFVTNVHFIAKTLSGSATFIGVRNVLTVSLAQAERTRLESVSGLDSRDEFSSFDTLKSRTAAAALSHRLSPLSSLNTNLSYSRAEGSGPVGAKTERALFSVGYSTQLGRDATGGLTYTHQRSWGEGDFRENMIMATLSMRF